HSSNDAENRALGSSHQILSDSSPVLHGRQRRSYGSSPQPAVKRAPDDGARMSGFSRHELSGFRDIKYRYMGLGKRRFDPMNFNIGLGKRGQAANMDDVAASGPGLIHSRDITPFSFDNGRRFSGTGSGSPSFASREVYRDRRSQSPWGRPSGIGSMMARASMLESVRKRLGMDAQNLLSYLVMGGSSKRARFDPKINFLGLGK
ncbi:hypothetical protein BaRGS_00005308, partial [Batillaria attramentaria]